MSAAAEDAPGLLVSVRDPAEAAEALAGGADIIDVKEPRQGSLGAASPSTIQAVIDVVAGRRPVSAALGEFADWVGLPAVLPTGLKWVKFGLAHCDDAAWEAEVLEARDRWRIAAGAQVVAVAYADWQRAGAPSLERIAKFAAEHRFAALLIDTHTKDGMTLLDWIGLPNLRDLLARMTDAGVPVALAGSLGPAEMRLLLDFGPRWFAVRGSACRGGRNDRVCSKRVRKLAELLHGEPLCVEP